MDAVVICGGQGTRVRSITKDKIPKILIPLRDDKYKRTQPFLEYLIENLYQRGVRRMTLAAGHLSEELSDYVFNYRSILSSINPWMEISILTETEPLGTGGAVLNSLGKSAGPHSDPFLVLNGDSLLLPDGEDTFEELYYELGSKPACAMFTCYKEHDGRYGSLQFAPYSPFNNLGGGDYHEEIVGFESGKAGKSWINCGWYIVRRELFRKYYNPICNRDTIQEYDVIPMSLEKDLFPEYLEGGQVISAITINEKQFIEIGTPEAIIEASLRLEE